jgi:hypothetical protein
MQLDGSGDDNIASYSIDLSAASFIAITLTATPNLKPNARFDLIWYGTIHTYLR